jgi:hypothetical protein
MMNDDYGQDGHEPLVRALRQVFAADHEVPPPVLAAAEAALAWRDIDVDIDAELALLFDSATAPAAGMRDAAAIRQVVFGGGGLTVECELTGAELVGQVLPPAAERVQLLAPSLAQVPAVPVDAQGWFTIRPVPPGPFSLRLSGPGRPDAVTAWLLP